MTLEQLTDIIKAADKSEITKALEQFGYTLCNKDKKLGKVGIVELVQAIRLKTEDYTDKERKRLFNGRICGTVKGYDDYEFVLINIYAIKPSTDPFDDEETAIQTDMLIWAKKSDK